MKKNILIGAIVFLVLGLIGGVAGVSSMLLNANQEIRDLKAKVETKTTEVATNEPTKLNSTDIQPKVTDAPSKATALTASTGYEVVLSDKCDLAVKFPLEKKAGYSGAIATNVNASFDMFIIGASLPQSDAFINTTSYCTDRVIDFQSLLKLENPLILNTDKEVADSGLPKSEMTIVDKKVMCTELGFTSAMCDVIKTPTNLIRTTTSGNDFTQYHFIANNKTYIFSYVDDVSKNVTYQFNSQAPSKETIKRINERNEGSNITTIFKY
jgi:hypothetical protein